jgi:hypothetical protein
VAIPGRAGIGERKELLQSFDLRYCPLGVQVSDSCLLDAQYAKKM